MDRLYKQLFRSGCCLTVLLLLLGSLFLPGLFCSPQAKPAFFNNRAADISGAALVEAPAIAVPEGLTGKGQIVGIADSGLDTGSMTDIHPDLQSEKGKMPKVVMLRSYAGRSVPDDPLGHGTHMAATVAGTGKASDGKYKGIAPGASLYFQALLGPDDQIQLPLDVAQLFDPAYAAGVRVHVDGWGTPGNQYGGRSVQIDRFVYEHSDFLPVFGAGNSGPSPSSVSTEANSKNSLTVGASQVPRPGISLEDKDSAQAASSSSRGPAADGRIKPELLAPGSQIISACSSLVKGNLPSNPRYTVLSGSSMASAVTGGALALLQEYLKTAGWQDPSAALQKALLINGARTGTAGPSRQGFGQLDVAGSILALKEQQFKMTDSSQGIRSGEEKQYKIQVDSRRTPFKATLAWSDPPAVLGSAKALVNDLDLTVQAPDGTFVYGNDFEHKGQTDSLNNVEQVYIADPQPGEYTVTVKGAPGLAKEQSYALVYGQPLQEGTVASVSGKKLYLQDRSVVDMNGLTRYQVLNGKTQTSDILPGADVYCDSKHLYLFAETWTAGGIQALAVDQDRFLLELNTAAGDGGYFAGSNLENQGLYVNGRQESDLSELPLGAEVKASINPLTQMIEELQGYGQEVRGVVGAVDPEKGTLHLLDDSHTYRLSEGVSLDYKIDLKQADEEDRPFGYTLSGGLQQLAPGFSVSLQVSGLSGEVQYILVETPGILGAVKSVSPSDRQVTLEDGSVYQVFPGARISRDGQACSLKDLQAGDHMMAVLLSDSKTILQLYSYQDVRYGRVVYYSQDQQTLYFMDNLNRSQEIGLDDQTRVCAWGSDVSSGSIRPGQWIRIAADPQGKKALQVDLAQTGEETVHTVAQVDSSAGSIRMQDGSSYSYSGLTRATRMDYSIDPADFVPGERVKAVTLPDISGGQPVLAELDSQMALNRTEQGETLQAHWLNGVFILKGTASGDQLYLYHQNGMRERIPVGTDGTVSYMEPMSENEKTVQVLLFDLSQGTVSSRGITIEEMTGSRTADSFLDLSQSPYRDAVLALAARGVVRGAGNGSFLPDAPVSRAEMAVMLSRITSSSFTGPVQDSAFTDDSAIPWWAAEAVYSLKEEGVLVGDGSGAFQPERRITRGELAAVLERLATAAGTDQDEDEPRDQPRADLDQVPSWQRKGFEYLQEKGVMEKMQYREADPSAPVKRGEAAAILYQLYP